MRAARVLSALLLLTACQSQEERLQEHLKRAEGYVAEERWEEAKIEYLNVVQLDTQNAVAQYELAEVLWKLEQYGEARWRYKETVRLDPAHVQARLKLASIEFAVQRTREASEHVDILLEQEPENIDALLLRGSIAASKGEEGALLEDANRALEIDPTHEQAMLLRAAALELAHDLEGAEATYRDVVKVHPTTLNHIRLAMFLSTRERPDEALENYSAAIEVAADTQEKVQARLAYANALMGGGDLDGAERELEGARADAPENDQLLLAMARFYVFRGEPERAEELLELRAASRPDSIDPLLSISELHRTLGNRAESLDALERALAIDPTSELALLRKAEVLMERSKEDPELAKQAREILNQVLDANPNSVRGLFTQGKFLLQDGRPEEAAGKLRRVVEEDASGPAYVLLANAYLQMGEPDLARAELLRSLQLDPGNAGARTQLAALYSSTGQRELAIEEARRVLEQRPGDVRLLVLLAGTLHGLERDEEAIEALDRIDADTEAEEHEGLRIQLANMYRRVGNLDRAHELLDRQAELTPDDARVPAEQALLELAERNPFGSIEILDEAIEKYPEGAALYELRARVRLGFARDGKPIFGDEAEADLHKAIEFGKGRSTEPYMLLASLYQSQNRVSEAVDAYEQAAEASSDPSIQLVLGMLYERIGRGEDAIRAYETVVQSDPRNGVALNNLAWLLALRAGDDEDALDRALQLAQHAKELLPTSPSVADTLGFVMLKKRIPSAAISLFREALDGYDEGSVGHALIRYHLGIAYNKNGETERAIQELEAALAEAASFPERSLAEALLKELKAS